jgi:argininosuccinate lyase
MHEFNQSLKYDKRMYAVDIEGSIAYAKALALKDILTKDELQKMVQGLQAVQKEWESGKVSSQERFFPFTQRYQFEIKADDEDIHTANERRLSEIIGSLGGKLHTGRSRNDQVATDLRLWLLTEAKAIENSLMDLIRVMAARAEQEKQHLMPGYTHLQVKVHITSAIQRYLTVH